MERAIRREREKAAIYGTIGKQGGDKEVKKLSARHRRRAVQMRKEYETFSKEHELAYYPERTSSVKGEDIYARTVGNTDGELTKSAKSGIINFGAISGAINPYGERADIHAELYYEEIRKMKEDVFSISKNTGFSKKDIQAIKSFIFFEEHDLGDGKFEKFAPNFMMAESWKRLIIGKQEPHDITLLYHELFEKQLMDNGLSQVQAHIEASRKFNYSKEAREYYAKIKKYRDM